MAHHQRGRGLSRRGFATVQKWLLSRESLSSQLERFGAKAVSAFLTAKPAVPPLQNARIRGPKGRGTQLCSPAPRPEGAGAG